MNVLLHHRLTEKPQLVRILQRAGTTSCVPHHDARVAGLIFTIIQVRVHFINVIGRIQARDEVPNVSHRVERRPKVLLRPPVELPPRVPLLPLLALRVEDLSSRPSPRVKVFRHGVNHVLFSGSPVPSVLASEFDPAHPPCFAPLGCRWISPRIRPSIAAQMRHEAAVARVGATPSACNLCVRPSWRCGMHSHVNQRDRWFRRVGHDATLIGESEPRGWVLRREVSRSEVTLAFAPDSFEPTASQCAFLSQSSSFR